MEMEDIVREVRMLEYKLKLLRSHDLTLYLPLVDRARILQAECEVLEKSLIRFSPSMSLESAISQLRDQLEVLSSEREVQEEPKGYNAWVQNHFDIRDELRFSTPNLCFRCSNETCIHYIYGFSTPEELGKHLKKHCIRTSSAPPIINQEDPVAQHQAPLTRSDLLDHSGLDPDFVYVSFDSSSAQKRKAQKQPARRRKKQRRSGGDAIKPDRQENPCLRCKILKKECGDETPCKQCPQQGVNHKGDYWKVLGCFRGLPSSFAKMFLPDSIFQSLTLPADLYEMDSISFFWFLITGGAEQPRPAKIQDVVTFANGLGHIPGTFLEKAPRPAHTLNEINLMKKSSEIWTLLKVQEANKANAKAPALDICTLYQSAALVFDTMFDTKMVGFAILLLEHKSSRPKRRDHSVSSSIGDIAVTRIPNYLLESLESFLDYAFSKICCRRKCLAPKDWLWMFADICSCSVFKSLLIDAQVGISVIDDGAHAGIAAHTDSAYKALVSIFAWAAKSDLLVEWYRPTGTEDPLRERTESEKETFETLCRLVQRDEWENRGIKSSKDFLMGLGSGFYTDGTYNGFYIQRYGLKEPRKSIDKSSFRGNEDMTLYLENSLQEPAPRLPRFRETGHLDKRSGAAPEQRRDNTAQDGSGTYQQHVAEGSSSPNIAPIVDGGQTHQSHSIANPMWDASISHQIAPLTPFNHPISFVCAVSECHGLRFATREELDHHTWDTHGSISY